MSLLYRLIFPVYPRRVRNAHGAEMRAAAVAEWRRRGGWRGAAGYAVWLLVDMARSRADERRASRGSNRFVPPGSSAPATGPRPPVPAGRRPTGFEIMDTFLRELRHTARALLRRPAFALAAVLTLALGIGATTAVFSVVDTVLLRPLPYPDPEQLVVLSHPVPKIASGEWGLSRGGYFYFREHAASLADTGAWRGTSRVITGDGPPERLAGARITWTVLSTLGVTPEIGRPITREDDLPGAPPVVLLSHDLWARSFGADGNVVGRSVSLDGTSYEIIGVMPASFRYPSARTDVWMPLNFDPAAQPINEHIYPGIARLREGATIDDARKELAALVGHFAEDMPTAYGNGFVESSGFNVAVRSLLEDTVGNVRLLLWIVLAAAAIVLVIACANVANLMLLRSEGRRREVAVRAALGASRGALMRYAISEGTVLALAGGLLGILLAWAGVRALVNSAPAGLPRLAEIGVHPAALLLALAAVALASVALGISSALRGHDGMVDALKHGGRASADRARLRLRSALVVTQVAMALVLLAGSGLLLRSFFKLRAIDPGFETGNVLTFNLSLAPAKYDNAGVIRFFEEVSEQLRALPGVTAAGVAEGLPWASRGSDNLNGVIGADGTEKNVLFDTRFAGPGYFEALRMRLVEGRLMERRDLETGTLGAVVTRSLAEELWPGMSALGQRIRPLMTDYPWHTVVGVIEDTRSESITQEAEPTVYFPYSDIPWNGSFYLAIHAEGAPRALLPAVQRTVWDMDGDVPLASVSTMEELAAEGRSRTTFTLTLLAVAAAAALLLGAVGIYGVISYAVSQRSFEIGVRMALGARTTQVAAMVLGQTMLLAGLGIVAGLVLAVAATRLMGSLLFEVAPNDPLTLAMVGVGLAAVAALAGALPARRATRVDAVVALRRE